MTFPMPKGSSLVDLANEQTLLLGCLLIGDENGPPLWVQLTAEGNDDAPARQITVVREDGEDCPSLWARVLSALRELKRLRGIQHRVVIACHVTTPPRDEVELDQRFNLTRALWHEADHTPDRMREVRALGMLADLHAYRGKLPPLQ